MHLVPFKYFRGYTEIKKVQLFVFNVTKTFPWFSTSPRGTTFPQNFVEYPPENIHFSEGFLSFVIKARSFRCGWCILFFSAEIAETEALHERKQPLPQTFYPWWVVITKIMTTSKFAYVQTSPISFVAGNIQIRAVLTKTNVVDRNLGYFWENPITILRTHLLQKSIRTLQIDIFLQRNV